MLVERLSSPNFERGRAGATPIAVVVHTTDGTFDAAHGWFLRADSGISAHYLVGLDGRILQFVEVMGDPSRMIAGADCGFGTFATYGFVAEDVVWAKLATLAEGAARASRHLFG